MKTRVLAKHGLTDDCSERINGECLGVHLAKWLNALGRDGTWYNCPVTNGDVRDAHLKDNPHLVAENPELAELLITRRRLRRETRLNKRALKTFNSRGPNG